MKLLDGSEIAQFVKERQAKQVRNLRQTWKVIPRLAVVQTVDNTVIDTYVRLKRQYAEDILVEFELHKVTHELVDQTIDELNKRDDVHGIIVQLPLADSSAINEVLARVASTKDVDGLGPAPAFDPATPTAISWLLAAYGVELALKKIAIIGEGRLVGAPLARMWQASGYDVTIFNSSNTDMSLRLREYDVIVTATGVPRLITPDMVQAGAVIVDAGTASEDGVVVGDIDPALRERDDLTITPARGGVGPLTIAALLDNVITAARRVVEQEKD